MMLYLPTHFLTNTKFFCIVQRFVVNPPAQCLLEEIKYPLRAYQSQLNLMLLLKKLCNLTKHLFLLFVSK